MGRRQRAFIIKKERKLVQWKAYLKKLLRTQNNELDEKNVDKSKDANRKKCLRHAIGIPEERTERMRKRYYSEIMAETLP